MPKLVPPPPVAPETWRALLTAAADFAALEPWENMYDSDVVGLIDPATGETAHRLRAWCGRKYVRRRILSPAGRLALDAPDAQRDA